MKKNEIQLILKGFNTCIAFKNNNIYCKVWYCIDTYYLNYRGMKHKTTLKNIITLLNDNDTTDIKIANLD